MASQIEIGRRVRVKHKQDRLGGPKYPGRTGAVIRENEFGRSDGGLWYVQLEATPRAKARVELFYCKELDLLDKDEVAT